MARLLGIALSLAMLLGSASAHATYSILIVDTKTGQVGAAVASCVSLDLSFVYRPVPDRGGVIAQAWYHEAGRDRAVALLHRGDTPAEIVDAITGPTFDREHGRRQYAVIDLRGNAAVFTGSSADPFAAGRRGRVGRFAYTVQGNILSDERVLAAAEKSVRTKGRNVTERLLLALEAGARNGQGDARCTSQGSPATSAFLRVDSKGRAPLLELSTVTAPGESAVAALRRKYDDWRSSPASKAHRASARGAPPPGGRT